MIDLDFLERLIRTIDASGLDSLEIERGGTRIRLGKTPPAAAVPVSYGPPPSAPAAPSAPPANPGPAGTVPALVGGEEAPPATNPRWKDVLSPMVGTFYRSPAPDAPVYADVGTKIGVGDTLCIIEAMKLMNELEAEVGGTVVEVCVRNGDPVEYGQVLFRIDPA